MVAGDEIGRFAIFSEEGILPAVELGQRKDLLLNPDLPCVSINALDPESLDIIAAQIPQARCDRFIRVRISERQWVKCIPDVDSSRAPSGPFCIDPQRESIEIFNIRANDKIEQEMLIARLGMFRIDEITMVSLIDLLQTLTVIFL